MSENLNELQRRKIRKVKLAHLTNLSRTIRTKVIGSKRKQNNKDQRKKGVGG